MEKDLCPSDWSHPGGAYEIINRLEIEKNTGLLNHLESLLTVRERKKGQLHKVFKDHLMQRQFFLINF